MNLHLLLGLALCALMEMTALSVLPADADVHSINIEDIEANPMEFLPLEVGNQWTYEHTYWNQFYSFYYNIAAWSRARYWAEPGSLKRAIVRALFEIPGYPYYSDRVLDEPEGAYAYEEFTIEITHTELIEGQEYFVFSDIEYDWPPVPNLFLAGQKVRFSEEGTLLFRWQGQDIPLYAFRNPDCCSPEYPLLQNENLPVEQLIYGYVLDDEYLRHARSLIRMDPPPSLSQALAASFHVEFREELEISPYLFLGSVAFLAGYGPVYYHRYKEGKGELGFHFKDFENAIFPVSGVISGKKLEFSYTPLKLASIQPTSWGQLKAYHRQGP